MKEGVFHSIRIEQEEAENGVAGTFELGVSTIPAVTRVGRSAYMGSTKNVTLYISTSVSFVKRGVGGGKWDKVCITARSSTDEIKLPDAPNALGRARIMRGTLTSSLELGW